MFGKIMSISDDLMWRYFEVLSFRSLDDIAGLKTAVAGGMNPRDAKFELGVAGGMNPRDAKFELGVEIVARFHDDAAAEAAKQEFISRFQQGAMPDDIPEKSLASQEGQLGLAHLLKGADLVSSTSEAFRMIKQGAVRIDGERIEDRSLQIKAGSTHIYQVGKRKFARVTLA
jgi:tyrosyl-tRNA synthetase